MNLPSPATSALCHALGLAIACVSACGGAPTPSDDTARKATTPTTIKTAERSPGATPLQGDLKAVDRRAPNDQAPPRPAPSRRAPHTLTVSNPRVLDDLDLASLSRLELTLHPDDTATRLAAGLPPPPTDACSALDLWSLAERAPGLTHLAISGCEGRIRAGFGALAGRIQHLSISDMKIDPVLAGRIAEMPSLVELSMSRVTMENPSAVSLAFEPASFSAVTFQDAPTHAMQMLRSVSPKIHQLRLEGPWVTADALRDLSILHSVRTLAFVGTGITNGGLSFVQRLKSLEALEFEEESINDLSPIYLRELPLTSLICRCERLGDTGARHMARLSSLQHLTLEGSRISPNGISTLTRLNGLVELNLTVQEIDAVAIQTVAGLPALEQLRIIGHGPKGAALSPLAKASNLRSLTLRIPELNDSLIPTINELQRLDTLDLKGTSVSDRGLSKLGTLPSLRNLNLSGTRISRSNFGTVGALHALETLDLSYTDVVDEAIRALAPLQRLRVLNLQRTLVTSEIMSSLDTMASLQELNISDTAISAGAVTPRLRR